MPSLGPRPASPDLALAIEHRRIALLVSACLVLPASLALAGVGVWTREEPAAAAGVFGLAFGGALCTFARRQGKRVRAIDAGGAVDRRPGRVPALALATSVAAAALAWREWSARFPWKWTASQGPAVDPRWVLLGICAVAVLGAALAARFYRGSDPRAVPEARGLAAWGTVWAWLATLVAVDLVVRLQGVRTGAAGIAAVGRQAPRIVLLVLVVELFALALLARPRGRLALASPVSLRLAGSRWNPISSVFAFLTEAFGIDLRGTWALTFIQRSLAPLALGLALVAWLATSFAMVDTSERGVVETFGRRAQAEPLGPGLHLVWPWPIQRVRRVVVDRVASMPIGYRGARAGASLLWTAQHAEQEYNLLLGDGHDVVTINAVLHYRVRDPLAYLYASDAPEAALEVVVDRAAMRATVGRSLDDVLSENLAELSRRLAEGVRSGIDELGLGFEVVDLTVMGLHPPVMVAKDYQGVVSAQVGLETRVLEAEASAAEKLPSAEARAAKVRAEAGADAARSLARARGEAATFAAHLASYRQSPELFAFRRWLEAKEAFLAGKSFVVVDERLLRDGARLWASGAPVAARGPEPAPIPFDPELSPGGGGR